MGATEFMCSDSGKSANEAFKNAIKQAQYDYGHSGYTGTIAEKDKFVMITLPKGENPVAYANKLLDEGDSRIDDKWGACGCIAIPESDEYLFFGIASC
jgi:hypothetical protein